MRITRKQAKELGIIPVTKTKAKGVLNYHGDAVMDKLCKAHGLPLPDPEYPFARWEGGEAFCSHPGMAYVCKRCKATRRRWRFDYLFDGWLAVEVVGGVWTNGHHSGGQDQLDDFEKHNEAAILGYTTLYVTPQQIHDGSAFALIRRAMSECEERPVCQ